MAGFMADAMAIPNMVMSQIGNVFTQIGDFVGKYMMFEIIAIVIIIGKCIFSAIMFVVEFFIWIFEFLVWLIMPFPLDLMTPKHGDEQVSSGFIWWLVRYIIVIAYKVINIPKCFIWYFIDTATWTMYLPFRFIFWVLDSLLGLGIVKAEHKAWDFLDQIDYFLHGKPDINWFETQYTGKRNPVDKNGVEEGTLGTGGHIIHFPDSVMRLCYSISPYRLAKLKPFPIKAFMDFMKCAMNPF
jgi:hypothetical protein